MEGRETLGFDPDGREAGAFDIEAGEDEGSGAAICDVDCPGKPGCEGRVFVAEGGGNAGFETTRFTTAGLEEGCCLIAGLGEDVSPGMVSLLSGSAVPGR